MNREKSVSVFRDMQEEPTKTKEEREKHRLTEAMVKL